ncbi:hypothetical protein [Halorientalis sp. IM1011]|uniref:DUF7535 family protein n=1 Tax=Halorientalis sp. IM1011 TaxID=1932360 RepID=UPI0012FBD58D|nr:hypothetical protein [Halorientalis sp. IM1011]
MVRTVRDQRSDFSNTEMNLIGYLVAAPLIVLLLPILPFLVVLWLGGKLLAGDE